MPQGGGLPSLLQAGTIVRPFHIPEVTERMPSVNLRRAASGSPKFRRKQEARSHEWGGEQKQACEAKKGGVGRKRSPGCIPEHPSEAAALEMRDCLASQLVSPPGKGGAE